MAHKLPASLVLAPNSDWDLRNFSQLRFHQYWYAPMESFSFNYISIFMWKKNNQKTFQSDLDKFANIYPKKTFMADLYLIIKMFGLSGYTQKSF